LAKKGRKYIPDSTGSLKLFMLLLGCKPARRLTEQHDVYFGIASSLHELVGELRAFWPEGADNLHIDAWREVTSVENYAIRILPFNSKVERENLKLYFINLGGYIKGQFEELHFKELLVAENMSDAIKKIKQTSFYKNTGFTGAPSHIDDKLELDVDEIINVEEIISGPGSGKFYISVAACDNLIPDKINIGYLPLKKLEQPGN
jgi:hypothetical protein